MKRPEGRWWMQNQVFSALLAAGLGSAAMSELFTELLIGALVKGPQAAWQNNPPFALAERVGWVQTVLFFVAAFAWFRPVERFLKTDDPAMRETALQRFKGAYGFLTWLWVLAFVGSAPRRCWAFHRFHPETNAAGYLARFILPGVFQTYYSIYFTVLYLEPLFFRKVAHHFYPGESLYERKEGASFTLRTQLLLLVLNLILIPLSILALHLMTDPGGQRFDCLALIFITLAYAAGYSEMLYRGIAQPIAALIKKMERVRHGDYAVRTSVLSGDEIGTMKAHFNEMVEGLAERERLRDTFGRYVSVEVAKQLLKSGKVSLGGESIEATILFSDIRDFTPMSEKMTPQELVSFLNNYFSYITEPIAAHKGVVNKFIGDAVMAIFAPQFGSEDHAGDAVKAAIAMRERLAEFNKKGLGPGAVRFGVGLHTGSLVAGNIGTEKRLEYTVIGDTVNVASRIESENKALGSTVLMSEDVYRDLGEGLKERLKVERCENVRVKGKDKPLVLYKLAA